VIIWQIEKVKVDQNNSLLLKNKANISTFALNDSLFIAEPIDCWLNDDWIIVWGTIGTLNWFMTMLLYMLPLFVATTSSNTFLGSIFAMGEFLKVSLKACLFLLIRLISLFSFNFVYLKTIRKTLLKTGTIFCYFLYINVQLRKKSLVLKNSLVCLLLTETNLTNSFRNLAIAKWCKLNIKWLKFTSWLNIWRPIKKRRIDDVVLASDLARQSGSRFHNEDIFHNLLLLSDWSFLIV